MADPTTAASPAGPATILARIDRDWAALWSAIEATDDPTIAAARAGDWPRTIVLMHIARWEDTWREAIEQRVADGTVASFAGADTWSEAWAAEDRDVTPGDARRRLREAHERMRALLGGLAREQWDDVVTGWVNYCTYKHYEEHLGDFGAQ